MALAYAPQANRLYLLLLLVFFLSSLPCLYLLYRKKVFPRLLRAIKKSECRIALREAFSSPLLLPLGLWLSLALLFLLS